MTSITAPLRFGVNYTPSRRWFYGWAHPDWASIEQDMDDIGALGADHVRILPLWTLLQPNRCWIDPDAVATVRRAAEIAGERGLRVSVDGLQGHLSSFDFVPSWLLSWHRTRMFADLDAVEAQVRLLDTLQDALGDLDCFDGITLGNELNQFVSAAHPDGQRSTPEEIEAWLGRLSAHRGPGFRIHAENDAVWFEDGHPFQPAHAARFGEMTAVHSWVFNGTATGYGPLSYESTHLPVYLAELGKAFALDPGRPVWVQEIGAPQSVIPETDVPQFIEESLLAISQCTAVNAVTWWCSHDVAHDLADFPELEYSLGLVGQDHRLKPAGERFKAIVRQLSGIERTDEPAPGVDIVIETDANDVPVSRREMSPGGSVFEAWMRLSKEGARPRLVTAPTGVDRESDGSGRFRDGARAMHPVPNGRTFYSAVSDDGFSNLSEAGA